MPMIVLLVVAFLIVIVAIAITTTVMRLAMMLLVAGFVGYLADVIIPGRLPHGWLGAVLAGLVGSWLGMLLIGPLGPSIFGIHLIPAFLGAIILAVIANVLTSSTVGKRL